jgi:hypothetical protein
MPKTWQQRIEDTRLFIVATNLAVNNRWRDAVNESITQKNQANALMLLSGRMSYGVHGPFGRAARRTRRHYRRAIVLIRGALLGHAAGLARTQTDQIPNANLPAQLDHWIGQWVAHEQNRLVHEYNQLLVNMGNWLQNHRVQLTGTASGTHQYKFYYMPGRDRYDFVPPMMIPQYPFISRSIYCVGVTKYPDIIANVGNIPDVHVTGAPVMVTTQLTGCSFMYQHHNGDLRAAHIWPVGIDGIILTLQLRNLGGFAIGNAGVLNVFGRQNVDDQHGYSLPPHTFVLGQRRGPNWELHCRQNDANNILGPTRYRQIL